LQKLILSFFLITLSFSEAYSLSQWLPLYSIPIFIAFFYRYYVPKIFLVFLFLLIIPLLLQLLFNYNFKSFNYFLFYLVVFFIYPVGILNLIESVDFNFFKKLIVFSFYFTSVFVIIEFCLNVLGFHIQDYIIRERETTATLSTFYRSFGFSSEPGSLSYYLNSLGPLSILFSKKKNVTYILYSMAILFTFSPVGILVWLIYTFFYQKKFINRYSLFIGITILLSVYYKFQSEIQLISEALTWKLSGNGTSVTERIDSYSYFLNAVKSNILGFGLGNVTSIGMQSPKNFFLFAFYEVGILGLIVLILPIVYIIFYKKNKFKLFFILSLLHLLFISQVQYPYTIFLFVIIYLSINNKQLLSDIDKITT